MNTSYARARARALGEYASNTLRTMTHLSSREYVDRIERMHSRLKRLHALVPRQLRQPGRRAISAAFKRLRPVETCAVVQHFHARLSSLMDSLRQDDELGVPATRWVLDPAHYDTFRVFIHQPAFWRMQRTVKIFFTIVLLQTRNHMF